MDLATPILCLALNLYYEARSEPLLGQVAVTQVVLNRVKSDKFPDTICAVIRQRKQFSWYWDGKSDKPNETKAWVRSIEVATLVYHYQPKDITHGALFYHATWICGEHWHDGHLTIGQHVFY